MRPEDITEKLRASFPKATIEIVDLTGGGDHFEARIVSERFSGLPLLKRHKLVYQALSEELKAPLHALALKTLTPEEKESGK